jgi:putative ABC transport system permease protein
MLKSYLLIALRSFKRHKAYSLINIAGLAVGMSCVILISLYAYDELSVDQIHEKGDRIHHVVMGLEETGRGIIYEMGSFGPIGEEIRTSFPDEVERVTQFYTSRQHATYGRKGFDFWNAMVDSNFFAVFTFPLVKGDSSRVLAEPWTIVISESMSKRAFGTQDPIGKRLSYAGVYLNGEYTVTGVMRDVPRHSQIQFDAVTATRTESNHLESIWARFHASHPLRTCVLLREGVSVKTFEPKLAPIESSVRARARSMGILHLRLQNFERIYLHAYKKFGITGFGDIDRIVLFTNSRCAGTPDRQRELRKPGGVPIA